MTGTNGSKPNQVVVAIDPKTASEAHFQAPESAATLNEQPATRSELRARPQVPQNFLLIVAAGAVVLALLVFVAVSNSRSSGPANAKSKILSNPATADKTSTAETTSGMQTSLFPIMDSGRPISKETHDGYLSPEDIDRTGNRRTPGYPAAPRSPATNLAGSLDSIPPFGEQPWQEPPYQHGIESNPVSNSETHNRTEQEGWDKASLVFVQNVSTVANAPPRDNVSPPADYSLGLPVGTRLRARLESAASTAVRAPVLAVIEYNYERDGEIIVPAGAKAVGQVQEADRSGYMRIEFDSLLLPDGSTVPLQAAASDLGMRPIKGRVEGKNTGKNILVRSLSGLGQASTMLLGRGSLDGPLSESALIRERVSNNIGEASDEQISKMAITARIVVTVSAGTDIYVVLEKSATTASAPSHPISQAPTNSAENLDQLRQLLQLQQELNQTGAKR